jgi:putative transposase
MKIIIHLVGANMPAHIGHHCWRMDETYIKVKEEWRYWYRAVDKHGHTIDFLLTEHRAKDAALRFVKQAIRRNGAPEKIAIGGCGYRTHPH